MNTLSRTFLFLVESQLLTKFYNKVAGRITFLQSVGTINIYFVYMLICHS